ncbi:hypothetical protein HDU76_013626 [Blyttiomyces sp. JEL0837]|nr:hypothetical protein HDU76_013626 [Blyttiomyces sp. JEL0837]
MPHWWSAFVTCVVIALVNLPIHVVDGLSALPQKTNVIKIGYISGFYAPYNTSDPAAASYVFASNVGTVAEYNAILWIVNETNYNPNDRGLSLKKTLAAIDNQGMVAIIGDLYSRTTVSMAVGAAINNVLHCAPSATTPQLSNKQKQKANISPSLKTDQAQGMLSLLRKFNLTTAGVIATDDEYGQGLIQSLQTYAPLYNVTITVVVPLTVGKPNFDDELRLIVNAQVQYILAVTSGAETVATFASAKRLGMLDGSYWWITSTGFGSYSFAGSPTTKELLNSMVGVWQVDNATPYDFDDSGVSATSQKLKAWAQSAACAQAIAGIFDSALKTGIPLEAINNRTFLSAGRNLSKFINAANIDGIFGKPYQFDQGGDIINDQSVLVYMNTQASPLVTAVTPVPIGNWSAITNAVSFFNDSAPLVFLGNKTGPPPPRQIPIVQFTAKTAMRYAFDAIVAICSLFTLVLLVYMMANSQYKIFKASSPRFLSVIIIGANISYVSIWLFSQYPMTDASCITYAWLKYMGFATVFGSLLLKTYRISVIFSNKKSKSVNVKNLNDTVLFMLMLVFMGLWAALLAIWTLIPSQRPMLVVDSVASIAKNGTILAFNNTPHCDFGDYNYVCLGAMVITLAFGVWLTYSVRNTPSAFNESKWIAMALYNWVVIGIVLNAITNFAVKDPDVVFVMEALNVIITQTGVGGFLFVPKMMEIAAGRGNDNTTFQSSGGSSGQASGMTSSMNSASVKDMPDTQSQMGRANADLQARLAKIEKEFADFRARCTCKA